MQRYPLVTHLFPLIGKNKKTKKQKNKIIAAQGHDLDSDEHWRRQSAFCGLRFIPYDFVGAYVGCCTVCTVCVCVFVCMCFVCVLCICVFVFVLCVPFVCSCVVPIILVFLFTLCLLKTKRLHSLLSLFLSKDTSRTSRKTLSYCSSN